MAKLSPQVTHSFKGFLEKIESNFWKDFSAIFRDVLKLLTTPENTITYHNALFCHPKILHKHCLQFLLGVKMAPRETENNAYAKFWGDKQRALWYVMVFLEWSIKVHSSLTLITYCKSQDYTPHASGPSINL